MGYRGRSAGLWTGLTALTLGMALALQGSPAIAQEAAAGQTIVERVDLVAADLQQAIALLKQQTGVEIVIEPSDKPYGLVTMALSKRPLEFVLQRMCQAAGASVRQEGGVYVIGPKQAAPQPALPAGKAGLPAEKLTPTEPAASAEEAPAPRRRPRLEKIRLQNSRPTEILWYLGVSQGYINEIEHNIRYKDPVGWQNPWKNVDTRYPTLQNLNAPTVPPVVPTEPASANRSPQNEQFGGGIGGRGGGLGGRGGGLGGIGGGLGGIGGGIGGGGLGGGIGGGIGGGGLGGGIGGGAGGAQALLPENIDAVIAYDVDNTIIARGDDDAIRELKEIIRLLDIAPRQLMIKAEFVTVSQNDLKTFGIDWQVSRANLQAGNSGFAGGPVFLNYATGNVVATLRATLTEGKGRLVNAPMVTTLNNVPVSIQIGRQVPVFVTSPIAAGQGTVVLQTQLIPVPVFTGIFVIPRINGDDSISMFVIPQVTDIVDTVTGPDGTTAPIITQQAIAVNRRIRNGETMVIGGLVSKNDQQSVRKIPLFGDLPLIGNLFRSNSVTIADSELLIFITPSIIKESTAGGGFAPGGAGAAAPGGGAEPGGDSGRVEP